MKKIAILTIFTILIISCNASNDGTTSASGKPSEPPKASKGITNYTGTWKVTFANNSSFDILIETEDNILYNNLKASSIEDLGNDRYKIKIMSDKEFSVTLKFSSDNEGTVEDDNAGVGVLIKN